MIFDGVHVEVVSYLGSFPMCDNTSCSSCHDREDTKLPLSLQCSHSNAGYRPFGLGSGVPFVFRWLLRAEKGGQREVREAINDRLQVHLSAAVH